MKLSVVNQKRNIFYILFFSILLVILTHFYPEVTGRFYHSENQVAFHLLLEFFSVFVAFTICSYGWKAFNDTKVSTYLWITSIFFAVGFLDVMHTLTYPGMPYFFTEGSPAKTGWFWISARMTETIAIVCFLFMKEKSIPLRARRKTFALTLFYILAVTVSIYVFETQLPILNIENSGPTLLKNSMEYFICFLRILAIYLTVKRYKISKDPAELNLFLAFSLLLMSELLLTAYQSVYDFSIVTVHIYKALGYFFIMRAFYFSKIQLSFQHKLEAEKNLKATESTLNSFFQHTPDSISIVDLNGRIVRTNPGFEKLYGWKSSEVVGKIFYEILPILDNETDDIFTRVKNGESLEGYETIRQRKDGTSFFINMTISPILNAQGEIIYVAVISRDTTIQKQTEQQIRDTEQELKETVHKQQGIIFKYKKIDGKYIHTLCDGELLRDMYYTSELIVGRDLFECITYNKAYYATAFYERAWNGEDTKFELELLSRTCYVTLKPIKRNGIVTEVIGFCIDISQLKKTEELLQKSEKLAVVGELAAGFAHEIRNPLTTLKGFTQLIHTQNEPPDETYIKLMLSELDRIEMITNEFMVVAKPQAVIYEKHDLKKLLDEVLLFSNPQAQLCNIQIDINNPVQELLIYCDKNQIKQVLINLIKNAFEAMPTGGKLTIEMKATTSNLTITITDTGCGIPQEIIPKLGEPFYTLKEKGTGLGLMVSFRIIEAHKGSIEFQSQENNGTVVQIKLPRVRLLDEG